MFIISLTVVNINQERTQSVNLAINTASAALAKDKMFRFWATSHGGIYVPATNRTPPNPHLEHIPDRDIITLKGKKLTLMNPAYMASQMMREYEGLYGSKGHITSLKFLNSQNSPDTWETKQLKSFQKGSTETHEIIKEKGTECLRMVKLMPKTRN